MKYLLSLVLLSACTGQLPDGPPLQSCRTCKDGVCWYVRAYYCAEDAGQGKDWTPSPGRKWFDDYDGGTDE